jgi:uncharacterized membrane protein YgaE (UPF0421/DUF939 family)
MNQYTKVIKIAVGSAAAIIIAYTIGLSYAVSAGIITLLTLQDTKKETLSVALKRIGAFVVATIIALILFSIFSYNPIAYGLFLLIFVGICYFIKIYDAIPMNAVLATHYLLEENMSIGIIGNEALLLLIGVGIGVLLNLYIPSNVKQIRNKQRIIEEDLKSILSQMAEKLRLEDKADYSDKYLVMLNDHIAIGIKQAYTNMNNTFFQETRYYIEYMEMRKQQLKVLNEICEKIKTLTTVTLQAREVADFIENIAKTLGESQNAKGLLMMEDSLLLKFKESPLPVTRDEFENRAVLYMILMDLRIFLKMKEEFADSLTEEQKDRYWKYL